MTTKKDADIKLMEMPTIFGKPLGDLTGAEGRLLAAWTASMFKGIGERKLGEVMLEPHSKQGEDQMTNEGGALT